MPNPIKRIKPVRPAAPARPTVRPPAAAVPPTPPEAPKVSKKGSRSVFLIMLGLPLFLISSVVLYKRVIEGQDKRVQRGEYTPDGGLRLYTPEEIEEKDKNSWLTWIFGTDK